MRGMRSAKRGSASASAYTRIRYCSIQKLVYTERDTGKR